MTGPECATFDADTATSFLSTTSSFFFFTSGSFFLAFSFFAIDGAGELDVEGSSSLTGGFSFSFSFGFSSNFSTSDFTLLLAVDSFLVDVSLVDSFVLSESSAILLSLGFSIDFFNDFV